LNPRKSSEVLGIFSIINQKLIHHLENPISIRINEEIQKEKNDLIADFSM